MVACVALSESEGPKGGQSGVISLFFFLRKKGWCERAMGKTKRKRVKYESE